MTRCQCDGIESLFDAKVAAKELKRYQKKGPRKETSMLLQALGNEGVEGMTLLDIGGGVGAIQHELLSDGVDRATNVDGSSAYIEAAKGQARRQGLEDRVSYHHGNFVDLAPSIGPADIVTLDMVICCYDDMESLVGLSSERARKLYGFVYPKVSWWMKAGLAAGNLYWRARRSSFRAFLHSTGAIDAILRRNGLQRRFYARTAFAQVMVYAR